MERQTKEVGEVEGGACEGEQSEAGYNQSS